MKQKFLNFIYRNNKKFFEDKIDLTDLYDKNKHFFDLLTVKEFVGHIPKSVNEPALKIFEDQSEMFEKWILWQSWYLNRKVINDPVKIGFYNGMMVYLKVLYTIARVNKKTFIPPTPIQEEPKVETPWIEKALETISDFKRDVKAKRDKSAEDQNNDPTAENDITKAA